jgi:glycosyl transferase family 4
MFRAGASSGFDVMRSRVPDSPAGAAGALRVAFDTRPSVGVRGVGRYARRLLTALGQVAGEGIEIVETHRPRHVHVFHSPWIDGAILRSPCPMVVTVHDVEELTRPSERMRGGGVHLRLRHLALARATHVIVPTHATAEDAVTKLGLERERVIVIPEVPDRAPDLADAIPSAVAGGTGRAMAEGTGLAAPPPTSAWGWEDVARATWRVYERALSEPGRAFISTPRVASALLGQSSGGSPGRARATSARDR